MSEGRKILIGHACDEYGHIVNPVKYVLLDIDTLRIRQVDWNGLCNCERQNSVNYRTSDSGNLTILNEQVLNSGCFPKFYDSKFKDGFPNVLLGVIKHSITKAKVGYRIYDLKSRKVKDVFISNGDTSLWSDLKEAVNIGFANAHYVQLAFQGSFYNEELYPVFYWNGTTVARGD